MARAINISEIGHEEGITAVPEKDENVGKLFGVDFHSYQIRNWPVFHHRSCIMPHSSEDPF